jgi:hypothetical protein
MISWEGRHLFQPIYSMECEFSTRLKMDNMIGENMFKGCVDQLEEHWYPLLDDDQRCCAEIYLDFKLISV